MASKALGQVVFLIFQSFESIMKNEVSFAQAALSAMAIFNVIIKDALHSLIPLFSGVVTVATSSSGVPAFVCEKTPGSLSALISTTFDQPTEKNDKLWKK